VEGAAPIRSAQPAARYGWFVTGTDTGIGKTLVSSAMLNALVEQDVLARGMKPVASCVQSCNGRLHSEDAAILTAAGNKTMDPALVTPYLFQREGIAIDPQSILSCYREIAARADAIVVEGPGGFRVAPNVKFDSADLATLLGLPVVLVVGLRMGCISQAVLTVEAIAARGLSLAGWVANDIDPRMALRDANIAFLAARIAAPLLGHVPRLNRPGSATVAGLVNFSSLPDWPARRKRI
jgi:dethiobiotin synthetase